MKDREIVSLESYDKTLRGKFKDLEIPSYKLRKWYSINHKIFFDCESGNKQNCLDQLLERRDLERFIVFFVVKEPSEVYRVMDVSFRNIGKETLTHFSNRFQKQFEPMTKMSVQGANLDYVEYVGFSYNE
jgi:hypothetical protein